MQEMEKLHKSLCQLAFGAKTKEVSEEYVMSDDGLTLKLRKCVSKNMAPDLSAIKLLLSLKAPDEYENMTDEELVQEKDRLLKLIENEQNFKKY